MATGTRLDPDGPERPQRTLHHKPDQVVLLLHQDPLPRTFPQRPAPRILNSFSADLSLLYRVSGTRVKMLQKLRFYPPFLNVCIYLLFIIMVD